MSDWKNFYVGSLSDINGVIAQINANCSFPSSNCTTWAIAQKSFSQDVWFCLMPPPEGYKEKDRTISQNQMISGIPISIQILPINSSWFKPIVPQGGQL